MFSIVQSSQNIRNKGTTPLTTTYQRRSLNACKRKSRDVAARPDKSTGDRNEKTCCMISEGNDSSIDSESIFCPVDLISEVATTEPGVLDEDLNKAMKDLIIAAYQMRNKICTKKIVDDGAKVLLDLTFQELSIHVMSN